MLESCLHRQVPAYIFIGVGNRSRPQKIGKVFFSGKYHVKFKHFVNFGVYFMQARTFCCSLDHAKRSFYFIELPIVSYI